MRKLVAFLFVLVAALPALAAARYAETLLVKETGSSKAIVMRSASVYIYQPGATANCATTCSGTTVTVYDSSNIQVGDIVEVGSSGLTAEVLTVPLATTFTVDASLTWTANDRFLRTNAAVTIYRDEGLGTTITQPATADTNGRVLFYVDNTSVAQLDLKAVSTVEGYRYVNPGVVFVGAGASAGGWTDSGSSVTLSTGADVIGAGGAAVSGTKQSLYSGGSDLFTADSPTAYTQRHYNSAGSTFWGTFIASNSMLCWNDGASSALCLDKGTPQRVYIGDIGNIDVTNPGMLNVRTNAASQRGLVVAGSAGQSANLAEFRDSSNNVLSAISPAGNVSGVAGAFSGAVSGTTGTFSGAVSATNLTLTGTLTVPGATTLNGAAVTWPAANASGFLKNNGSGTTSWQAAALTCSQMLSIPLVTPQAAGGTTARYVNIRAMAVSGYEAGHYGTSTSCGSAGLPLFPAAFNVTALRINMGSGLAANTTFTLVKGCADQAVTCTITAGNTTCNASGSVSFVAGDYLHVKVQSSSAGTDIGGAATLCLQGI